MIVFLISNASSYINGAVISADGGRTVFCEDEDLRRGIENCCKKINLKGHFVGDKFLFGPGDMEGHKGRDGR